LVFSLSHFDQSNYIVIASFKSFKLFNPLFQI
jgi:hypothetical protein